MIQIHAKMEQPVHKLEVAKMILNALVFRVTLDGFAIEVFIVHVFENSFY